MTRPSLAILPQATKMKLSPFFKLDIAWKAEDLDVDSLWSNGKDSLSDSDDESPVGFRFKLRSGIAEVRGAGSTTGTGRTRFVEWLINWWPCPSDWFSIIGFSISRGSTEGLTVLVGIAGTPEKLVMLLACSGGGSGGFDGDAWLLPLLSWRWASCSSFGIEVTW